MKKVTKILKRYVRFTKNIEKLKRL